MILVTGAYYVRVREVTTKAQYTKGLRGSLKSVNWTGKDFEPRFNHKNLPTIKDTLNKGQSLNEGQGLYPLNLPVSKNNSASIPRKIMSSPILLEMCSGNHKPQIFFTCAF